MKAQGINVASRGAVRAPDRPLPPRVPRRWDASAARTSVSRRPNAPRGRRGTPLPLLATTVVGDLTGTVAVIVVPAAAGVTLPSLPHLAASVLATAWLWVALVATFRGYRLRLPHTTAEHAKRLGHAGVALACVMVLTAELAAVQVDATWVLLTVGGMWMTSTLVRCGADAARRRRRPTRVLLVGHARDAWRLLHDENALHTAGFSVVGVCVAHPSQADDFPVPVSVGFHRAAEVAKELAEAVVVLPCPELDARSVRRLSWSLDIAGVELLLSPPLTDVAGARITSVGTDSIPLQHVQHPPMRGLRRAAKQTWERVAAVIALVVLAPLLAALVIVVRNDSPGPALFRQRRVGKDGRSFTMLKFRTMTTEAETLRTALADQNEATGVLFKMRQDPRITRSGRLMRKYSLDELPQLLNVARGEMSLVGPRPALPEEVASYDIDARRRLAAPPGLTGLWQVSGRSDLSWEQTVRLDVAYVDNWSLWRDLVILVRTVRAVVGHRGAY